MRDSDNKRRYIYILKLLALNARLLLWFEDYSDSLKLDCLACTTCFNEVVA